MHHKLQTVFGAALLAATAGYSFAQTSTTFNYDNLGRLKSSSNGSYTTKYSIDAADNILSVATTSTGSSSQPGATIVQVTAFGNLRTLANSAGYTGAAAGNFQFVVASNITVVGGLDTGTWPSGSTLSLVVNGNVYGSGGAGGNGNGTGNGSPGAAGGDAVVAHAPITITVNANGSVKAGGGGGGGGGYGYACPGGGGGGGFPNGVGGSGGAQNQTYHCSMPSGSNGTAAGGGAGGTGGGPAGGAGGAPAAAGTNGAGSIGTGGAGGSAGYAVRKNGNAVSVNGGGVVTGTVG